MNFIDIATTSDSVVLIHNDLRNVTIVLSFLMVVLIVDLLRRLFI